MQSTQKPPASERRFYASPRVLCILGFVFAYLVALTTFVPQVSAAALSSPGGNVADPVVRQVDIARPAVVRIVTQIDGQLTVRFTSTVSVTFPQTSGAYTLRLSGSGAFVSSHGEILTADHVVNPPHGQDMDAALYSYAAEDIANYINSHFQVTTPYSANDVYNALLAGSLPSTSSYGQPKSQVYLSTSYVGPINAAKLDTVPASGHAVVDRIEASSDFNANDVAIIHVSGMDNMPSIQLGDSSKVTEQDNLTIIGYPGLADLSQSATDFLTSSINKIYVSALKTTDAGAPVIQVAGNVEHGDSGGPALDENGNIVGIVSFGYSGINGDYGQTTFLQASSSALALVKSLGLNTTPGSFESVWTQAINDYASSASGHWQKSYQELQGLASSYPNFQGITPYLNFAKSQASIEKGSPSSAGNGVGSILLVVLLIVLLLVVLGVVFFFLLRKSSRPVVVTPGGTQYPAGAYGAYPQPASGVYARVPAAYGAGVPYLQPLPDGAGSAQPLPGLPQPLPYGAVYQNYTSPTAYGALPALVPQTPQPLVGALPQPVPVAGPDAVFSLPLVQTPQPGADAIIPQLAPVSASEPGAQSQLPSGDSWPTFSGTPEEPVASEDEQTVQAHALASEPSQPVSPAPSEVVAPVAIIPEAVVPEVAEATIVASAPSPFTWVAPCGHTNVPNVRFCRVCGQPVASTVAEVSSNDVQ